MLIGINTIMASIPINNLTNKTDINGAELLPFVRDGKTYRCSVSGLFYSNAVTNTAIASNAVTPAKLSTGGPSWTAALTGGVFSVQQNGLEFGTGYTQDYECFIDLHSAATPTDFETRISRAGGANGNLRIQNRGTGHILLSSSGNGNVGIGTSTPGAKLDITGGSVDDSIPELRISGSSGNISTYVSLCAGFYNPITLNQDKGIIFTGGTVNTGNLVIAPHSTSIGGIRMLSSGNVGIGKSTPTTTLDVNGTVTATLFSGPASDVSDGVITAAKLDGAQTGTAPIYGARAWCNFNGTSNSDKNGTYSRSGNVATITVSNHNLIAGNLIFMDFTVGTGTAPFDGLYEVASVTNANTFTVTTAASVASTGTVILKMKTIRGSGNISCISAGAPRPVIPPTSNDTVANGYYIVNFLIGMPDSNYAISGGGIDLATVDDDSVTNFLNGFSYNEKSAYIMTTTTGSNAVACVYSNVTIIR